MASAAQYPEWYASDNRFSSRRHMERAHQPIVELALATLPSGGGNVLDLGCGNGALLRTIAEARRGAVPFGIDVCRASIEHARELLPSSSDNFSHGDMFEDESIWPDDRRYAVAILALGRLEEAGRERAGRLRQLLRERCDHLLVYAYERRRRRYGNLAGLAAQTEVELLTTEPDPCASLARVP